VSWTYGFGKETMSGLDRLKTRLTYHGGETSLSRINDSKLWSLRGALKNSYQSALIKKLPNNEEYQCLINPDRVKPDYDNKVISIESSAGMRAGSTFYWPSNNTYWLIYLSELTETAYFRGYIRRCRYNITINNTNYYVYIQGPTETDIKWNQKSGISWSKLNHSLTMYVARTTDSLEFFKRFNTLELDGQTWQVEATDSISIEGIIEVNLGEYFNNSMEDLQEVPVIAPINTLLPHIVGDTFVKPYDIETYTIALAANGVWSISNSKAIIKTSTSNDVVVEIISGKSGTFNLVYTYEDPETLTTEEVILAITIESL
jgi:hypothetical protein